MIITNINLFSFSVYRRRSQRQACKALSKFCNEQSTIVQISNSDDEDENNRGDWTETCNHLLMVLIMYA